LSIVLSTDIGDYFVTCDNQLGFKSRSVHLTMCCWLLTATLN